MTKQIHKAADLFPMMSEAEFATLREDIRANGLKVPIALDPAGAIIDGRNRLRACQELGIEPQFVTVTEDPFKHVFSMNFARRQLTPGQIADIACRFLPAAEEEEKEATERMRAGGRKAGRGRPQQGVYASTNPIHKARERVANAVGINPQQVARQRLLRKRAPEVAEKVARGEVPLTRAYNEHRKRRRAATADESPKQSKPALPSPDTKRGAMLRKAHERRAHERRDRVWAHLDAIPYLADRTQMDLLAADAEEAGRWKLACREAIRALRALLQRIESLPEKAR